MRLIKPQFTWQDMWVGLYVKTNLINTKYWFVVYVCLIPMLPFQIIVYKPKRIP